jgi:hypothetical protein
VLVGWKWWEFVEIVVDFIPPGTKLTDLSFTQMQEHVVVHIGFLFEERIVLGGHMFCDSTETFNMYSISFVSFWSSSCSAALSLKTRRASPLSEERVKLKCT